MGFDAFVSLKFAHAGKRGLLTYLEKTLQESLKYEPETYELEKTLQESLKYDRKRMNWKRKTEFPSIKPS